MASTPDSLYVTYVDIDRELLKIWGQRNRIGATYIERQLLQLNPEFNRTPCPNPSQIHKGMFCFAKYTDDNYYRARVLSFQNDSVGVLFVDYGNRDIINMSDIRVQEGMDADVLAKMCEQAEEFYLARIAAPSIGWTKEIISEIRRDICCEEFPYHVVTQVGDKKILEIQFHNDDFSNYLVKKQLAIPLSLPVQSQMILTYCSLVPTEPKLENSSREMSRLTYSPSVPPPTMRSSFRPLNSHDEVMMGMNCVKPPTAMNFSQPPPFHSPRQVNSSFQQMNKSIPRNPYFPSGNFPQNQITGNSPRGINPLGINQYPPMHMLKESTDPFQGNNFIQMLAQQVKQYIAEDNAKSESEEEKVPHHYVNSVLEVGNTHNVIVSFIDDGPWSFSVQPLSSETELQKLMDELSTVELVHLKPPIVLGHPCIASSALYGNLCRGVVVSICRSAVKVYFVDFGNTEDLPFSSIYELPAKFFKIRVLSQKFSLSGLQKVVYSEDIKKFFKDVVQDELLMLRVMSLEGDNLPTCELYLKDKNIKRILNEKIRELRSTLDDFPKVGETEDVVVTWVVSPQKFFVQLYKRDADLYALKNELAEVSGKGQRLTYQQLSVGFKCLCLYEADGQWYRAVITSVDSENAISVFYVDYGNTETVNISMLRRVETGGLIHQMRNQAIQCSLKGFENKSSDQELTRKLESLTLEKQLQMTVVSSEKELLCVQLFDNGQDISSMMLSAGRTAQELTSPFSGESSFTGSSDKTPEEKEPYDRNENKNFRIERLSSEENWREKPKDNYWNGGVEDQNKIRGFKQTRESKGWEDSNNNSISNNGGFNNNSKSFGQKQDRGRDDWGQGFKQEKNRGGWEDKKENSFGEKKRLDEYRGGREKFNGNRGGRQKFDDNRGGRQRFEENHGGGGGGGGGDRFNGTRGGREKFDGNRGGREWTRGAGGDGKRFERGRDSSRAEDRGKRFVRDESSFLGREKKVEERRSTRKPIRKEDIAPPGSKFEEKTLQIGSCERGLVTYYFSPHEFFVQLLSDENEFKKMMADIQTYYSDKYSIRDPVQKCADTKVSDKKIFSTFARTLPPSSKVSKSVISLLRAFDWNQFIMVVCQSRAWVEEVTDAIKELADLHGMTVTDMRLYSDYIPRNIEIMDRIVVETYRNTRVYVFIGEHIALVDFVKCLQVRHLLDKGEYIVISVDDEIYDPDRKFNMVSRPYIDPYLRYGAGNLEDIMGFKSVLKLTPSYPRNPEYQNICEDIKQYSAKSFSVPYHNTIFDSISVPIHAMYLYDAVMIYARALTEVIKAGQNPKNGTEILQRIWNRSYHSVQGYDVFIDSNGDAEGNYSVIALMDDLTMNDTFKMSMQPVGFFQYNTSSALPHLPDFKYYNENRPIPWSGGNPPKAEPVCGFRGEKCVSKTDWRVVITLILVVSFMLIGFIMAFKHYRYEQKLACLLWKIDMKDITIIPLGVGETTAPSKNMFQAKNDQSAFHINGSLAPDPTAEVAPKRAFTKIALYKGNIVAMKRVHKKSVDLTRSIRKELKQIREVRHENIIPFIGACVDHNNVYIITPYCARGSLEDVLANKDLHLDNMFVSSLVADLLRGLIYLHDSDIVSHGNLKSSNCLIDSRWVLQISDFGLHEFKAGQEEPENSKELKRLLWRAPELLRDSSHPPRGTQKGDVYSFGILLYEIVGRKGPWGDIHFSAEEIILKVQRQDGGKPFRPQTDHLGAAKYIIKCMESCWEEDPEQRPDIRYVRVKLKEMQAGLKPNIFDNMLAIMEKYASNLEVLVSERTDQLTEEKKKTDALLHRMLPKSVAESLKKGDPVEAESFDCVTIYFSDIVGFTELSAVSTPFQVVDLLNDLYTCCDSIISHYDVYKVETIGDAYMVVSGLPIRNGDRHAGEIASMALHMLRKINRFEIKHRKGEPIKLRIGIHSGHCVAGVVGLKMPRYCLFGDTVNTASRMESSGEAFKIHISEVTKVLLERLGGYRFEERGLTPIKGKGEMRTYWLTGEDSAKRLARIKKGVLGTSAGSVESDRLSEIPDLLRRPAGEYMLNESYLNKPSAGISIKEYYGLHKRAFQSCKFSPEMGEGISAVSCADIFHLPKVVTKDKIRDNKSAPVITFVEGNHFL